MEIMPQLKVQFVSGSLIFRNGNFNLEDRERSSRPAVIDDDKILTLIENNLRHMTRDIAEIFHISHMSVIRHLKNSGT